MVPDCDPPQVFIFPSLFVQAFLTREETKQQKKAQGSLKFQKFKWQI